MRLDELSDGMEVRVWSERPTYGEYSCGRIVREAGELRYQFNGGGQSEPITPRLLARLDRAGFCPLCGCAEG